MRHQKLRELNLNFLLTLDAIFQHRNISHAAEYLGVTHGAVSQALSRLRVFFRDPLLTQVKNRMVLTPLGETLEKSLQELLAVAERTVLVHEAFEPHQATGSIDICITDVGEFALLSNLYSFVAKNAPNLTIRTHSIPNKSFEEAMSSGEIDLAIAGPLSDIENLKQQKIYEHEIVAITSKSSSLANRLTCKEYASAKHIVLDSPHISRSKIDAILSKSGLKRDIVIHTPYGLTQPFLVEQHQELIATVPRLFAVHASKSMHLKVLELEFETPCIPVYQYWHERFDKFGKSIWLRNVIRDIASKFIQLK